MSPRVSAAAIACLMLSLLIRYGVASPLDARKSNPEQDRGRLWTPADSVAVRYFDPTIHLSPDARLLLYVDHHGDLSCDCERYELTIYEASAVRNAMREGAKSLKPLRVLERRSHGGPNAVAIFSPQWQVGSRAITFEGVDERGIQQVYEYHVDSGVLNELTNEKYNVHDAVLSEKTAIYDVQVPVEDFGTQYPVHHVTREELQDSLPAFGYAMRNETYVSYDRNRPWKIENSAAIGSVLPVLSSVGRMAIALREPVTKSEAWKQYDRVPLMGSERQQFFVIDALAGYCKPIFDAPSGTVTKVGGRMMGRLFPRALWAADNRHVVLVNTALPLMADDRSERRGMSYVVAYDTESGSWSVIEPLESKERAGQERQVVEVGWLADGEELLVAHEQGGRRVSGNVYSLKQGVWVRRTVSASVHLQRAVSPLVSLGFSIEVRQGANEPPEVVASSGKRELTISSRDPALEGIWLAKSEPFEWRTDDGETLEGGLRMPRSWSKPIPLVIQAYAYDPNRFQPDGPFRHVYAAQALVSRGMAVLDINIPGEDKIVIAPGKELENFAERIRSAVETLATRGVVDPSRVGMVGFSRAGYYTYYTITHPGKFTPAAAIMDDAFTGSYTTYLWTQAMYGVSNARNVSRPYEGSFWDNKEVWLARETTFNVDHVKTPALFSFHGKWELPYALETIGAFELNHRVLEVLEYPDAAHTLEAPQQRLASFEATVDWMSFWLQGYEDSRSDKSAQYERWRMLREEMRPGLGVSKQPASR